MCTDHRVLVVVPLPSYAESGYYSDEEPKLWGQAAWIQIPVLSLAACVTSGKLLDLAVSQFFHL